MPYSELKPGRLRLEDETTGTAYLFIQKDDDFLWCDVSENILQVLSCVKFGTIADRPSAGKKGRLYFTTDTKELFYDDGSNWVRVVSGETGLYDADRDTYIEVEKSADEDIIRGYVANTEALKISSAGILTFPKQSACCAYLSADQSITANTATKVALDTALFDIQNEFDSTNNRITVTEDGIYAIIGQAEFDVTAAGDVLRVYIYVNGGAKALTGLTASNADYHILPVKKILQLSAGDYVELYVNNISSDDTIKGGIAITFLCVAKIA